MVKGKKFVLAKYFDGEPKESDLKLEDEELPALKDGEILIEAQYLSVDPYMRVHSDHYSIGDTMIGSQVGKIVQSKAKGFKEGRYIFGYFGWRTLSVHDPMKDPLKGFPSPYLLPDFQGLPNSLALGVLGMPGNTAYFGLVEICKPSEGETFLVTSAGGAVGSTAGQIAKLKGCRVIGLTGSTAQVDFITNDLGFDVGINYKTQNITEEIKRAAPNGIDIYFDNVGGEISSKVLSLMNHSGRIAVCGSISSYNSDPKNPPKVTVIQPYMLFKELKMEGFHVHRWQSRWMEGINTNLRWIVDRKIKYRETVTEGFENMPKAFIGMMRGENLGKAVVKV